MNACDSCAWIERCVAANRCAREPLTAEQENRVRQIVAEVLALRTAPPPRSPVFIGVDRAERSAHFRGSGGGSDEG